MEPNQNEKVNPKKKQRVDESTFVDYVYQDLSCAPFQAGTATDIRSSSSFPAKLHAIVSTPEYQHIIGWLPHGRSWEVKDKELLVSAVLHDHFNHNNFESFNRQVNLWGFKRLHRPGLDYKSYYHEAFLRSRPDLVPLIRRLKKGEQKPIATTEPNFYQMPFLPQIQSAGPENHELPLSSSQPLSHFSISTAAAATPQGSTSNQVTIRDNNAILYNAAPMLQNFNCQNATANLQIFQGQSSNVLNTADTQSPSQNQTAIFQPSSDNKSDMNSLLQNYQAAFHTPLQYQSFQSSLANQQASQISMQNAALQLSTSSPFSSTGAPLAAGNVSYTQHQNTPVVAQSTRGDYSSILDQKPAARASQARPAIFGGSDNTLSSTTNSIHGTIQDTSTDGMKEGTSNSQYTSTSDIATSNAAQPRAASTNRKTPLGAGLSLEGIAMLSNPPNDPILREFAEQYLPYFEQSNYSDDSGS